MASDPSINNDALVSPANPPSDRGPRSTTHDSTSSTHDSTQARHALSIRGLSVDLSLRGGTVRALHDVSFSVAAGEAVAVLGESGSGKSMTALAIMGLLPMPPASRPTGSVKVDDRELLTLSSREIRKQRGTKMSMIFQDALSALNPVLTVGTQISEAVRAQGRIGRGEARQRAIQLLADVGIPSPQNRYGDFPHQFSGGMRQRVMIAMALALDPVVLIADEPTTALDVTIQAQIMSLLNKLRREREMALVLITHDLGVVADVADRVVVMYAGRVVEVCDVDSVFSSPAHPYTAGLLASMPSRHDRGQRLATIPGSPPPLTSIPSGCPFRTRCQHAQASCESDVPALREVAARRYAACHFAEALGGARD
jgi:oligopeptide transport system ATP-binding protein